MTARQLKAPKVPTPTGAVALSGVARVVSALTYQSSWNTCFEALCFRQMAPPAETLRNQSLSRHAEAGRLALATARTVSSRTGARKPVAGSGRLVMNDP